MLTLRERERERKGEKEVKAEEESWRTRYENKY